ncbi:MAG: phosphoglyceromutase [Cytophagales bacterium]|nr:phosphoglyceromutase [Cytophagales bacterium]
MKQLLLIAGWLFVGATCAQPPLKTGNVILVTLDGMRWQEVFGGADSALMKQQKFLKDEHLAEKYWRSDPAAGRAALFPFLWSTVATQGQVHGNRNVGSKVNVTNQLWFSYPGYNEILTGSADDGRITSNDKKENPNVTVLEFIHDQPGFKGRVAAFTSWDVFAWIINRSRSGIYVSAGLEKPSGPVLTQREELLNQMLATTPNPLGDVRLDAFTFYYGMEYMKSKKPRVVYFAFDETDDFAHMGEYAGYLNSAHAADGFLSELWNYVQSDPFYANKTTLLITVDHGRGTSATEWKSHGKKIANADEIWFAVIGPDTPGTGEQQTGQFYQNQFATTIAKLLGVEYQPGGKVGEALPVIVRRH